MLEPTIFIYLFVYFFAGPWCPEDDLDNKICGRVEKWQMGFASIKANSWNLSAISRGNWVWLMWTCDKKVIHVH